MLYRRGPQAGRGDAARSRTTLLLGRERNENGDDPRDGEDGIAWVWLMR